jgi:hypothetical protein
MPPKRRRPKTSKAQQPENADQQHDDDRELFERRGDRQEGHAVVEQPEHDHDDEQLNQIHPSPTYARRSQKQLPLFGCDVCGARCSRCGDPLRESIEHYRALCCMCILAKTIGGHAWDEDPEPKRVHLQTWLSTHATLPGDGGHTEETREAAP